MARIATEACYFPQNINPYGQDTREFEEGEQVCLRTYRLYPQRPMRSNNGESQIGIYSWNRSAAGTVEDPSAKIYGQQDREVTGKTDAFFMGVIQQGGFFREPIHYSIQWNGDYYAVPWFMVGQWISGPDPNNVRLVASYFNLPDDVEDIIAGRARVPRGLGRNFENPPNTLPIVALAIAVPLLMLLLRKKK
jgi:hypothetical protein